MEHFFKRLSSFNKINRFQFSLRLIAKNDQPFTAIAYDSGYFDQSHFIRDFKSFTGLTPSQDFDKPSNFIIRPSRMDDIDDEPPF